MPRVSRAEAERRRRQVIDSTARLIREKGADQVSVPQAMATAGLTHGGFYRHFASKDDLVAQALGAAFAERREAMDHLADEPAAEGRTPAPSSSPATSPPPPGQPRPGLRRRRAGRRRRPGRTRHPAAHCLHRRPARPRRRLPVPARPRRTRGRARRPVDPGRRPPARPRQRGPRPVRRVPGRRPPPAVRPHPRPRRGRGRAVRVRAAAGPGRGPQARDRAHPAGVQVELVRGAALADERAHLRAAGAQLIHAAPAVEAAAPPGAPPVGMRLE